MKFGSLVAVIVCLVLGIPMLAAGLFDRRETRPFRIVYAIIGLLVYATGFVVILIGEAGVGSINDIVALCQTSRHEIFHPQPAV